MLAVDEQLTNSEACLYLSKVAHDVINILFFYYNYCKMALLSRLPVRMYPDTNVKKDFYIYTMPLIDVLPKEKLKTLKQSPKTSIQNTIFLNVKFHI